MKLEVWTSGSYDSDTKQRVSWRYVIGTKSALGTAMEIARVECRNKTEEEAAGEKKMALEIARRWNQIEEKDVISQIKQIPKIILPIIIAFLILTAGGICEAKVRSDNSIRPNERTGKASWYSSKDACGPKTNNHKGCPTASGKSIYKLEKQGVLFCAVPKGAYRIGSNLRICNRDNSRCIVARVLDTGGFKKYERSIDLCKLAFAKLAPLGQGIINVKIEEIK